ncbi:hypothetical protein LUZ60_007551 [Juncus effusus]|nr:hypothetical protein LUZ60_007551 [Juncus effusus]
MVERLLYKPCPRSSYYPLSLMNFSSLPFCSHPHKKTTNKYSKNKNPKKKTTQFYFLPKKTMVIKTIKKEPLFLSPNPNPQKPTSPISPAITGDAENRSVLKTNFLNREKVLRRRLFRLRQLSSIYKRHYWSLVEELRTKHRDYYWEFGKSPLDEGDEGLGFEERRKCAFSGCKTKAMALTSYCHSHILFDRKQTLYKPCNFVIKSNAQEQITCRKPVLRASNPSLCPAHFHKSQKGISQALKKIRFNNNNHNNNASSSKTLPKMSVLICESIREIQRKRKLVDSTQNDHQSTKD